MALAVLVSLLSATVVVAQDTSQAPATEENTAIKPAPRGGGWMKRHESFNARVEEGNVDLLMIGDSITHGWEGSGREVWQEYYGKRNAVNLGIGGDRTQHVLWRLENGNIEGISPKLAVLMIGTNNCGSNTPEEIAEGVDAIVQKLRKKLPKTKVLVLAIFPRGEDDTHPGRQVNMKANKLIAKQADGKMVHFLDINGAFLTDDRILTREVMPDLLHPREKGYRIWAAAMEPTVAKLLGEK
jgi:beta-glucosidase